MILDAPRDLELKMVITLKGIVSVCFETIGIVLYNLMVWVLVALTMCTSSIQLYDKHDFLLERFMEKIVVVTEHEPTPVFKLIKVSGDVLSIVQDNDYGRNHVLRI